MLIAPRPGGGILDKIFPENYQATPAKTYKLSTVEITALENPDSNPTITTITRDDMDKSVSKNMGEALRFTEGLFFRPSKRNGVNIMKDTIFIRGHSERTIGFYLDGIPINDIYFQGQAPAVTDLATFTSFGLSAIQVSKGYVSPAFASSTLGGAINMVTSVPTKDLEFAFKYTFITSNENRLDTQIGRNLGDSYYQITYSQMDRKSLQYSQDHAANLSSWSAYDIPNTMKKFRVLSGKYGWFMGDNHEYSLNFRYQKEKMDDAGGYPEVNYDSVTLYLLGNSKFTEWFSLDSRIYYHKITDASMTNSTNQSWGGGAVYNDYTTGFIETLNFKLTENQNLKFGINLKHDSHRNTPSATPSDYADDYKMLNSTEFIEYAIRFNEFFRFVASGSYQRLDMLRAKARADNQSSVVSPLHNVGKNDLDGWSLQGILYIQPSEWALFHANVGRKSNIPNFSYLYGTHRAYIRNGDLDTENAINYELGAKFEFANTSFGATGYYQDLTNALYIGQTNDTTLCNALGRNYCYQVRNSDGGYIYGGEIFFKQNLLQERLKLGLNWAYTQKRVYSYDSNTGERTNKSEFTDHPRQNINGSIIITPRKEYDLGLFGSVQTSRYAYVSAEDDYVHLPTVVYFDLVGNYYLKDNLKLSLGAYNVLDSNYNYSSSKTGNNRASVGGLPGRRVFTSVEYRY